MQLATIIEIVAVIFSTIYLFLLVKENIWCWLFGILSSFLSIYLFVEAKLYSESILYGFYVLVGFYGWYTWSNPKSDKPLAIKVLGVQLHLMWLVLGFVFAFIIGYIFQNYTDAEKSFIDANTTAFSLIASYLEAHKYLYAWIYWIVINGVSVWLYFTQGLSIYAGLMVLYFVMSGVGFWRWRKRYLLQAK